jgi:hypothetical protein
MPEGTTKLSNSADFSVTFFCQYIDQRMHKIIILTIAIAGVTLLFHRGAVRPDARPEKDSGWKNLFDGKTLNGWRTYRNEPADSWEVVDGQLHAKPGAGLHRADLVTTESYGSFDLQWDWKVDKGANSGMLYHVQETHEQPYETGPEYQLIDDSGYPGKLEDWQKSGADYAMHPPLHMAVKPRGEYNHSRIVVSGDHIQHWLNGVLVADFRAWTPEWLQLKQKGKWKDYPDYGNAKTGLIDLQDHGGGVWFRNIRIKVL